MADSSRPDCHQPAEETLSRWVREHGSSVRGFLVGMVHRPEVADDLLQEVFQRAWQSRDRYQDRGRERAYLLRIADRLACDRGRRLGREVTVDDAAWQRLEPPAADEPPLEELARQETRSELASALDRLSETQRRVLLLRYYSDLDFAEIARLMEIPTNTALSHARRGLLAMKKLLSNHV